MSDNLLKPAKPYLGIIDLLHSRNLEGEIGIALKGKWDYVSVPVLELHTLFGELAEYLEKDSYFTPNTLEKPHEISGKWTDQPYYKSVPRCDRTKENVLYLNACYLDFDCYKIGRTAAEVAKAVVELELNGTIPPATIKKYSGRGFWLLWLIYEPTTRRGAKATPENRSLWLSIQKELARRLGGLLNASVKATIDETVMNSENAFTRIEGSQNSKAHGERVFCNLCFDDETRTPFAYSLEDLKQWLGLNITNFTKPRHTPPQGARDTTPEPSWKYLTPEQRAAKKSTKQYKGWHTRWRYALEDMITIWQHRGKIYEGKRNRTLLTFVNLNYRLGLPLAEITALAHEYGTKGCEPPLTPREIKAAITSGTKKEFYTAGKSRKEKLMSYAFVSNVLGVSESESQTLCRKLLPAGTPAKEPAVQAVKLEGENRRKVLAAYIDTLAAMKPPQAIPPIRTLREYLAGEGFRAAKGTITNDIKKLGVKMPRRQRKAVSLKKLPLETAIQ